jgi:hypothetical protein
MLAERIGSLVLTYFLCTTQSLLDDHTFLLHKEYSKLTDIASNYYANLQLPVKMQIQREADGFCATPRMDDSRSKSSSQARTTPVSLNATL